MKIIELSQVESETVERAFYEVDSYEKLWQYSTAN